MIKISIFSGEYWKNLFHDLMGLFKMAPVQVLSSLIVTIAVMVVLIYEGYTPVAIVWGVTYFIGTNILLLIASEKVEHGFAQNSVIANVLFGTRTNKLKLSYFYWVFKMIVVVIKYSIAPLLFIMGLFQYQNILNKLIAQDELENRQ